MTPSAPKHSISPESSDGFASVGTILPKEKAAPLPGGLFMSPCDRICLLRSHCFDVCNQFGRRMLLSGECIARCSRVFHVSPSGGVQVSVAAMTLRRRTRKIKSQMSKADVAQLVEQPIRNRQVTGSSPVVGSRNCLASLVFSYQLALGEPNSYLFIHGDFRSTPCVY